MGLVARKDSTFRVSGLWRQPSVVSEKSIRTFSSGDESCYSTMSSELFEFSVTDDSSVSNSQVFDQTSFITQKPEQYHQFISELAVIYELYHPLYDEVGLKLFEGRAESITKNAAQKKEAADQIRQFEEENVRDLLQFHEFYLDSIRIWIDDPVNAMTFEKCHRVCSKDTILELFADISGMIAAHRKVYEDLDERLEMWGSVQFMSDILNNLYTTMTLYENLLTSYPTIIVMLDILCNNNTLNGKVHLLTKLTQHRISQSSQPIQEIHYYLKKPLTRLSQYFHLVSHIATATDNHHPDYEALTEVNERFRLLEKTLKTTIKDRLAHVRVLEASRYIQYNPVTVSVARRLLMTGSLIRVNQSDMQSTADNRTYLLYNDIFMFSQKLDPSYNSKKPKSSKPEKLQYKGMISLKFAYINPLSTSTIAGIKEIKKPTGMSFLRRLESVRTKEKGKENENENNGADTILYGFEIKTNETSNAELIDSAYGMLPGNASGNGSKKHYIMRCQSEIEQNTWIKLLRKASQEMSRRA